MPNLDHATKLNLIMLKAHGESLKACAEALMTGAEMSVPPHEIYHHTLVGLAKTMVALARDAKNTSDDPPVSWPHVAERVTGMIEDAVREQETASS